MKHLMILFVLLLNPIVNAQDQSPALVTDRPTQSLASTVLTLHHFQIESGGVYTFDNKQQQPPVHELRSRGTHPAQIA